MFYKTCRGKQFTELASSKEIVGESVRVYEGTLRDKAGEGEREIEREIERENEIIQTSGSTREPQSSSVQPFSQFSSVNTISIVSMLLQNKRNKKEKQHQQQ